MNMAKRHITTMAIALMLASSARARVSSAVPADTTFYNNFSYIRFVGQTDTISVSDEELMDISAKVVFAINTYQLKKNDAVLKELAEKVLPQINRDSLELVYMIIRGAASPEGPYALNKQLSEKRAQALIDFIKPRITIPIDPEHFRVDLEAEDYRTLCIMMRRACDKYYPIVQAIYDKHIPVNGIGALKDELQAYRGGELWKRLVSLYFPSLRVARVVLFFRKAQTEAVEQKETVPAVPVLPVLPPTPTPTPTADTTALEPVLTNLTRLPRRELLAVKTNLLMDFAYMPGYNRWCPLPNVALEYYPLHGHLTYGLSVDFPWWRHYKEHKYFQVRNYQAEVRYYMKSGSTAPDEQPGTKAAFGGLYLSGYAHAGLYGICFDADRGWEGEGVGAGLGIGYVMPLTKTGHWRLEFGLQAGYFFTKYDPYQFENPIDPNYRDNLYYYKWTLSPDLFKRRQHNYHWFGPTRAGITLIYDLLYRRIAKPGISFNAHEPQNAQKGGRP